MKITLKDNVIAEVSKGTTVALVAEYISESLAKNAVCGKINGKLVDLNSNIGKNCKLEIITMKDKDAINVLWHSSSHILAQAVKSIYPNVKIASGGYNEFGFYYDFDFKSPIEEADLSSIEDEMQKIITANFNVFRVDLTKEQAFKLAEENGEIYKLELLNKLQPNEKIGLYNQGDFYDFCDGPHLKATGAVKAFKLTKIEKIHFDNDERNKILTRIYGVSFFYKKDLDKYLKQQDSIAKRNHLIIGAKEGFLGVDPETNGIVLLPKGQRVIKSITSLSEDLAADFLFEEISSIVEASDSSNKLIGTAYRIYEKNGLEFPLKYLIKEQHKNSVIGGGESLFSSPNNTRHKFVTFAKQSEIDAEIKEIFLLVEKFYSSFGLPVFVKLHVGDEDLSPSYTKIKSTLKKVLDKKFGDKLLIASGYHKLDVIKVEYMVRDLLGRDWTIGNSYIDLSFAQLNKIAYTENEKLFFPVTIVNNLCKSYEKLFAILIESYAGKLPYWCMSTPLKIVTTYTKALAKSRKIVANLKKFNIHASEYFSKKPEVKYDSSYPVCIALGEAELKTKTVKIITKEANEFSIPIKKFVQEMVSSKLNRDLECPVFLKNK